MFLLQQLARRLAPAATKVAPPPLLSAPTTSPALLTAGLSSTAACATVGRWHREKQANRGLYRYGYKDHVKRSGALPRLDNDAGRVYQVKVFTPANPFAPKTALHGQNDYIDILGSDDLHPTHVHYHLPAYLRGFRHNTHFQAMIQKKNAFANSGMKHAFPAKHETLEKKWNRLFHKSQKKLNQKRFTNYAGLKYGPAPNPYQTKYPF